METKKYFDLIEKEYLDEVSNISKKNYIEEAFQIAYLILFFHNSKDDQNGKNIILGDLFISILNRDLLLLDRKLLKKITKRITLCYSKKIISKEYSYTKDLLDLLKEVN